jgi:hypothetical protein
LKRHREAQQHCQALGMTLIDVSSIDMRNALIDFIPEHYSDSSPFRVQDLKFEECTILLKSQRTVEVIDSVCMALLKSICGFMSDVSTTAIKTTATTKSTTTSLKKG